MMIGSAMYRPVDRRQGGNARFLARRMAALPVIPSAGWSGLWLNAPTEGYESLEGPDGRQTEGGVRRQERPNLSLEQ